MKTYLLLLLTAALFLQVSTSCRTSRKVVIVKPVKTKSLPPGQAKKITGSQSAKPYAPGQQKKNKH
jgi:hypothetical protein